MNDPEQAPSAQPQPKPVRPGAPAVAIAALTGIVVPLLGWLVVLLFPVGMLGLAFGAPGLLLLCPLAIGLAVWVLVLAVRSLRTRGVRRPAQVGALAVTTPVVGMLVAAGTDGLNSSVGVVAWSVALSVVGAVVCALAVRTNRGATLPVTLLIIALVLLAVGTPLLNDHYERGEVADMLDEHGRAFAILDADGWHPHVVSDQYNGLTVIYRSPEYSPVHLMSWTTGQPLTGPSPDGEPSFVRQDGTVTEARLRLDDGTIAALRMTGPRAIGPDLVELAEHVRQATETDRENLIAAVA